MAESSYGGARDRRRFPRPPLWLNLLLLVIAAATFAYARHHRTVVDKQSSILFQRNDNSPTELIKLREQLANSDLTNEQLKAELARKLDQQQSLLASINGSDFYLTIDSQKKKLYLRLGKEVVRDADIEIGDAKTLTANGKTWTFVPVKGAFTVAGKEIGFAWQVPEWVYAMRNQPIPAERPTIANGLGKYVIFLPDNYVIHSPPSADSPLAGRPKPGSYMASEADLAAMWARINTKTKVYIF